MHETSEMSPAWMIGTAIRDEEKLKMFKPRPLHGRNTRCETSRVIFADINEPKKSIFNLG